VRPTSFWKVIQCAQNHLIHFLHTGDKDCICVATLERRRVTAALVQDMKRLAFSHQVTSMVVVLKFEDETFSIWMNNYPT
jgi:hypothetical protein